MFFPSASWRDLHHAMHYGARAFLLPRSPCHSSAPDKTALPNSKSLSSTHCLQNTCDNQNPLLLGLWSREVFVLCEPNATLSQSLILFLFSSQKGLPLLCSTTAFLSCSSPPCILHLPSFLPPKVEIFLSVLRTIFWVFQVI